MGRTLAASMLVLVVSLVAPTIGPVALADERAATPPMRFVEAERFVTSAASQGVAVDAEHFYAIGTRAIEKYRRSDGKLVAHWEAGDDERVVHLNAGIVQGGQLVCAHSNYPRLPMRSSILRFDPDTLRLLAEQELSTTDGSLTWIDRHAGSWWLLFAHYAGRGGEPGKGPEATRLVEYSASWNRQRALRFPPELIARFAGYSSSGGSFGPDGLLYVTGHDAPEVYALRIPATGDVLEWVGTAPAPIAGQGIAWDPFGSQPGAGSLWGIVRGHRQVRRLRAEAD
jgi:hypothetical protein